MRSVRSVRSVRCHAAAAALLGLFIQGLAPPAAAQMFKDPRLQALYAARAHDELERVATQRRAAAPDDAQAVLALALGALRSQDAVRRQAAIGAAQACLERAPQAAPCHYALGVVLGVQALGKGLLEVAGSAGRVRGALVAALEAEPAWYAARSALVEFHLLAPAIVGGSVARARELARSAPRAEHSRALEGRLALHEQRHAAALAALEGLDRDADGALADDAAAWTVGAAFGLLNAGQAGPARPVFERLVAERPGEALGPYGLGRVAAAAGAHEQALEWYTRSARLEGAAALPIAYRSGIALQELGRHDAARAALREFVAAGKGQRASLDDARRRLRQLGG